mmetsp:Transcript_24452/g.74637  ORF Transcript_24452/g.74637 Transcript_24452/m.74637 type:complete len:89 (+) Transcript_24452:318-584(+)|eukprot:scaffold154702_cov27-Tisochrysis_lutea.AAC.3
MGTQHAALRSLAALPTFLRLFQRRECVCRRAMRYVLLTSMDINEARIPSASARTAVILAFASVYVWDLSRFCVLAVNQRHVLWPSPQP